MIAVPEEPPLCVIIDSIMSIDDISEALDVELVLWKFRGTND